MKCPACDGPTKVLESRTPRRRRRCLSCSFQFTTKETVVQHQYFIPPWLSRAHAYRAAGLSAKLTAWHLSKEGYPKITEGQVAYWTSPDNRWNRLKRYRRRHYENIS